jgi:mRNA interferase YafQ
MALPLKLLIKSKFQKDVERMQRRGKDMTKLKTIIDGLVARQPLPAKNQDHKLQGKYLNRRECHIEPDWLLVYKREETTLTLEQVRRPIPIPPKPAFAASTARNTFLPASVIPYAFRVPQYAPCPLPKSGPLEQSY